MENHYEKIRLGIDKGKIDDRQVELLVQKMKQTYKKRSDYRLDLYLPLSLLARSYFGNGKFKKAAAVLMELFELLKDVERTLATVTAINAFNAFKSCEMMEEARECLRKAVLNNCIGDEDFFNIYFKRFMK